MQNLPKVSIITVNYNGEEVTCDMLESLRHVTYKNLEVIVVDNASTDGTQKYLMQMGLGGVILNRQNLSCGAAWNQGILARQTDWTIVILTENSCKIKVDKK